jgi:hypothetical protein
MPNLRLIRIVAQGNGAAFQPDPSGVQADDTIHWNNETNEDHWLETTTGDFVTDNIPAGTVSNPGFVAVQDVSYRCRLHPQEQGTIAIVPAVVMAATMEIAAALPAGGAAVVESTALAAALPLEGDISAARKRKSKKPVHPGKAAKKKAAKKKAVGKRKNG